MLLPLCDPPGQAAEGEEHREVIGRVAHRLVDQPRVEVDVRIELPGHEVLVLQRDPLELERDLELRVEPGLLEDVVGDALDQLRPRVIALVDAVSEAHQPSVAGLHLLDEGRDVLRVPDLVEHAQDCLVCAPVERPVQGGDPRRHRGERIDVGRSHAADGARRAVLLVVGVQDQEDLERPLEDGVRLVPAADLERHVDEVADVVELVPREHVRQAARVTEHERRDGRHLRQQPKPLQVAALGVGDVLCVGIEGRERTDCAEQHAHRVGVVAEALEELLDIDVDVGVVADVVLEPVQLVGCRELPLEQEVGGLEERRVLCELLDRVAAVAEDAPVAVDERDRAATRGGVEVRRVVRHQAAVTLLGADLAQVGRVDRPVGDRERVLVPRAVVGDCQRVLGHGRPLPGLVSGSSQIGGARGISGDP